MEGYLFVKGRNKLSVSEIPGLAFPVEGCSQLKLVICPQVPEESEALLWVLGFCKYFYRCMITSGTANDMRIPPHNLHLTLELTPQTDDTSFEEIQCLVMGVIEASQNTVTRWSKVIDANCTQNLAQARRAFLML